MSEVRSMGLTNDPYANGVLSGDSWTSDELTFSFPTSSAAYGTFYAGGSGEPYSQFETFNSTQRSAVRTILKNFEAVSGLSFTEMSDRYAGSAELRMAESGAPSTGWAYLPSDSGVAGDIWLNSYDYNTPQKGNYAYFTLIHEIGHALGLKHAHEESGSFPVMPKSHDSMEYTVMSYRSYVGAGEGYRNETWGYAQSLMMDDIAAVQKMHGADYTTNAGATVYCWSASSGEMFINGEGQGKPGGNQILLTIWDGGGVDTYDMSNYDSDLTIDLTPGAWSKTATAQLAKLSSDGSKLAAGNIANARLHNGDTRSLIENALGGSGDDGLTGNAARNALRGGDGADVLKGFGGRDNLKGGDGRDILKGGTGADVLSGGYDNDSDSFVFTRRSDSGDTAETCDRILLFDRKNGPSESHYDTIDLSRLDADASQGDQSFRFVEKFNVAGDNQAAGQVCLSSSGADLTVLIDFDGNNTVDMMIRVVEQATLTRADFLL